MEQSRRNLCVREKELEKSEELKESELQRAKTLYEEGNARLLKAIKYKNFNEVTVAQGLLEVAKKKMDDVMEQSRQCSSKRSQLTKNKNLLRRRRVTECYGQDVLLIYCNHRPIWLNQRCTQSKPLGNKTFCFRNFHII